MDLKKDALFIVNAAIEAVLPDAALKRALGGKRFPGRVYLVSVGKAAWQMAKTAAEMLGGQIAEGAVITKYGHVKGEIPGCVCYEAGHPVLDENTLAATRAVIRLVEGLRREDTVLFLLSGGGSALFEDPLIPLKELQQLTRRMLASGADIVEVNTVRKHLSRVKGGRFAKLCEPARVYSVVLSDIIGNPLDMIASGPACRDSSTCEQALAVLKKYRLSEDSRIAELLQTETPKSLWNVETTVIGSVGELCLAAKKTCEALGYETVLLTDRLCCEAREAGSFLGSIAESHARIRRSTAFIAGGETVVHLTGSGRGGRNQELALAAAEHIAGCGNAAIFSVGSDGTDGPTDAAGGYVDGRTQEKLEKAGLRICDILEDNDAYNGLKAADGLIMTGPTGTNVNDLSVALIRA